MALLKKEVVIRETSTITKDDAIAWTKNWLAGFSVGADDSLFADVFDARNGNIIRVFDEKSKTQYEMSKTEFTVLDTSLYASNERVEALESSTTSEITVI